MVIAWGGGSRPSFRVEVHTSMAREADSQGAPEVLPEGGPIDAPSGEGGLRRRRLSGRMMVRGVGLACAAGGMAVRSGWLPAAWAPADEPRLKYAVLLVVVGGLIFGLAMRTGRRLSWYGLLLMFTGVWWSSEVYQLELGQSSSMRAPFAAGIRAVPAFLVGLLGAVVGIALLVLGWSRRSVEKAGR